MRASVRTLHHGLPKPSRARLELKPIARKRTERVDDLDDLINLTLGSKQTSGFASGSPLGRVPSGNHDVSKPPCRSTLKTSLGSVPTPTPEYLERVAKKAYQPVAFPASQIPLLVVLDLNRTLVLRASLESTPIGSPRKVTRRPYLSTFLTYLFQPVTTTSVSPRRPLSVMVWTSAQPHNAMRMCQSIGLAPPAPLANFWTRNHLGLDARDYASKVDTFKDLSRLWKGTSADREGNGMPRWGIENTVLLDNDPEKAASTIFSPRLSLAVGIITDTL
jgi:hypothetical protein